MDPDSMLSRVVRCQGPPSHKGSVGWIKDVSLVWISNCFQTVRPRTRVSELVTKAVAPWEDAVYPLAIQPPGSSRRRENTNCQRRGSLDVGDHMQTATSYADAAIGAASISLGVSELELARIDVDAGARAEDMRERLAQYARKSAPGLMAHEWAHE
jgi:hypothetical protein